MILNTSSRYTILTVQYMARFSARSTRQTLGQLAVVFATGVGLAWLPLPLAISGLAATLAILLILLRPVWGLVLLIPAVPFSSTVSVQIGAVSVGGMEALLLLILVAWLVRMAAQRQIVIPHPPLFLPWLLWLGVILISWPGALSLGAALTESLKWLEMLALFLFIVANVKRRHLPWIVGGILLAGMTQAIIGLYQFVFRVGPEGFLLFGGRFLRAYGTFRQPNPYAGYLGLVLPIALSLAIWGLAGGRSSTSKHHKHSVPRLLAARNVLPTSFSLIALGLILAALYASQSRGAWIGFVAAGAIVVMSMVRRGSTVALFVAVVALLTALSAVGAFQNLSPVIAQRLSGALGTLNIPDIATAEVTDANFATIGRLAHWKAALDMWRDHLWLGVGFGNYAVIYPAYAIGRWLDPLGHAHNYYLNIAADTGLLGLLAYGLYWLAALRLGWAAVHRSNGFQRAVAAGGLGVLVHLSVHNLVDNLYVQGMYLHIAIVLGLLCTIYQSRIDNSGHRV